MHARERRRQPPRLVEGRDHDRQRRAAQSASPKSAATSGRASAGGSASPSSRAAQRSSPTAAPCGERSCAARAASARRCASARGATSRTSVRSAVARLSGVGARRGRAAGGRPLGRAEAPPPAAASRRRRRRARGSRRARAGSSRRAPGAPRRVRASTCRATNAPVSPWRAPRLAPVRVRVARARPSRRARARAAPTRASSTIAGPAQQRAVDEAVRRRAGHVVEVDRRPAAGASGSASDERELQLARELGTSAATQAASGVGVQSATLTGRAPSAGPRPCPS